jgi:hypothetical protein
MAIKNPDICNNLNNELTHNINSCSLKYLGIIIDNHGRIPIKNLSALQRSDYLRF